jgi:hypothetical protein
MDGIIVRVESGYPPRSATADGERELGAITPFFRTPLNWRRIDRSLSYALHRIANDHLLRGELRVVCHVLKLATTAFVARVMRAWRVDPHR